MIFMYIMYDFILLLIKTIISNGNIELKHFHVSAKDYFIKLNLLSPANNQRKSHKNMRGS